MTDRNRSPLAIQVEDLVPDKPRGCLVYGLVVHTTGRGIVARARRRREDILEHVIAHYRASPTSAHYVGGWSGTLVQITPDDRRVPHVGVSAAERQLYLSGRWRTDPRLSASSVLWQRAWLGQRFASPQHLFPGPSANGVYVGLELPPLERPRDNELWYTDEQHELVARLADDLRERHGWPDSLAAPCPRLLGHKDLDAFGRWDSGGGWDPGALRARPRFDWGAVAAALRP